MVVPSVSSPSMTMIVVVAPDGCYNDDGDDDEEEEALDPVVGRLPICLDMGRRKSRRGSASSLGLYIHHIIFSNTYVWANYLLNVN